jgi:hypothetical protein
MKSPAVALDRRYDIHYAKSLPKSRPGERFAVFADGAEKEGIVAYLQRHAMAAIHARLPHGGLAVHLLQPQGRMTWINGQQTKRFVHLAPQVRLECPISSHKSLGSYQLHWS